MAKKAAVVEKVKAEAPKHGVSDKARGVWKWQEDEKEKRWTTALIPDGDWVVARVQRTFSKNLRGQWDYCAYRNGNILGMRPTAAEARALCESGVMDPRPKRLDLFLKEHPGEMPAFLQLTHEEREAVRKNNPLAVPRGDTGGSTGKRRMDGGDDSDPGTRQLRMELAGPTPGRGKTSTGAVRQRPSEMAAAPDGKLARLRDGNPKKPGTAAHTRWELLLKHCDRGTTVKAFLDAGGNPETLRNAVLKGFAKVEEK